MDLAVRVLDVGAGFTGVLRSCDDVWPDQTALVDFGAQSGSRATAALQRHTSWWFRPALPVEMFVLSHPHLDHYNGLLEYAMQRRSGVKAYPPLFAADSTFHHPRIPDDADSREFLLRLASVNAVASDVPDIAIAASISVCAAGVVNREPLARGMRFSVAGEACEVLWPPQTLPDNARARLRTLVDRYDTLANELQELDDSRLHNELAGMREAAALDPESVIYGRATEITAESLEEAEKRPGGQSSPSDQSIPPDAESQIQASIKSLQDALSDGGNLLSLVFTSIDRRFVFLGDLDRSLHGEVAVDLMSYSPELVISAHHGTHFGDPLTELTSRYVISSVGGSLAGKVRSGYDQMGMHLRTDRAGDISALLNQGSTRIWTHLP